MIFKVRTLAYDYSPAQAKKLHKLGFEFNPSVDSDDLTMKDNIGQVDLKNIQDLVDFVSDYGEIIIRDAIITIYDGYNE